MQHSVTIHQFIRDTRVKFSIRDSPQSPDTVQNLDEGIFDIRISSQSYIKENCHNSRISDDIDMKLGPVTKLDKINNATSKNFYHVAMLANSDAIVILSIYSQFGVIRKPDYGRIVCKTYIFIVSNLLSYKK